MQNEITLKQLRKSIEKLLPKIQRLNEDQLDFLWFDDFYDGALSGILKFENKEYRYEIVTDHTKVIYPRLFAIFDLTEEELKEQRFWNDLYVKLIKNQPENKESHELFFKEQKKQELKNYSEKIVLWYYVEN